MNVIKFKDEIIPGNELFNNHFRGKYCYAVRMSRAVTFESLNDTQYTVAELTDTLPEGSIDIPLADYSDYIDYETTTKINSIAKYVSYNNYIPDSDITIEDLKVFRCWLADSLLNLDQDIKEFDEKTKEMLWYYKKNMYDDVVKQLTNFQSKDNLAEVKFTPTSACACTHTLDMTGVTSTCDPVAVYKKSIYEFMVLTFSQIDFWTDFDKDFLAEFKAYVDGIIGYNLPLYSVDYITDFVDCSCVNTGDALQQLLMSVLKNLSKSLEYIINDSVEGHKNFIATSFKQWAERLYEKMYWK